MGHKISDEETFSNLNEQRILHTAVTWHLPGYDLSKPYKQ